VTRLGLACALLVIGCSEAPRPSSPPPPPPASVELLQEPGDILQWDFAVRGLPAVDRSSGAIVVADVSHGDIASSLALSIRWLLPDGQGPQRAFTVLDDAEASHVLNDIDQIDQPPFTSALAVRVRAHVREANRVLATAELRPTTACRLDSPPAAAADDERASDVGAFGCTHPQRLTCGALVAELRGDELVWRVGAETGATKLGWSVAPMTIGDGPPKPMRTCIEEAHFDPTGRRIAARIDHACEHGGGDACLLRAEWHAVALR
jgi:hypothetical protein